MSAYAYPNPQAIFYQQYDAARRDEVVGILLALFLGTFGVHHFYLRRTGLGILYACFCWTGIPALLGFIECFFMPGRVREFNAIQAAAIAASLGIAVPGWGPPTVNAAVNIPPVGASAVPAAGFEAYAPPPAQIAVATYPALAAQVAACTNCQRTNPPGARFCSGCGRAL
jgi:TM2 domain-containing membrane protein YozV